MANWNREQIRWRSEQDAREVRVSGAPGGMSYDGTLTGKLPRGFGHLQFVGMNRKQRRALQSGAGR